MRIVPIIQARMGSSRFPGKALASLAGRPLLERVVDRVRLSMSPLKVAWPMVVATSTSDEDQAIADWCDPRDVLCYRGHPTDCLQRLLDAAKHVGADAIVRITADCPMVDPGTIIRLAELMQERQYDYVSNCLECPSMFPDGSEVEIVTTETLDRITKMTQRPEYREHVTLYIRHYPNHFDHCCIRQFPSKYHVKMSVDTPEDLDRLAKVYAHFSHDRFTGYEAAQFLEDATEIRVLADGGEIEEEL